MTRKTYRNPIIQAREIALEIQLKELTQGQMARKLGCSLSRVSQMLHLLKLPEEKQREIEALGDHWDRRVVTERGLRGLGGGSFKFHHEKSFSCEKILR